MVLQTNSLSLHTHRSQDEESSSTSPSSQIGSVVVVVAAIVVVVIFSVVVGAMHVSSGARMAHRPLTWMASLSAHVQNTLQPSIGVHSSCSPWHPNVHAHSSEHGYTGPVVVVGAGSVVEATVVVVSGALVDEKIDVTVEKIVVTIPVVVSAFFVVVDTGATHLQQTSSVLSNSFPCSAHISSVNLQKGTQLSWYRPSTYVHSHT
jgi:hypothetical protein